MYQLTKRKNDDVLTLTFDTEAELQVHLISMWRHTDWHLVAVVKL